MSKGIIFGNFINGRCRFDPVNYGIRTEGDNDMGLADIDTGIVRQFETGATRDTASGKIDMEGFTHPMVMKQYAKYMNMCRFQSDGNLRDSDNWQKGIPLDVYAKSLRRHHDAMWEEHRGFPTEAGQIAHLCAIMFNAMGYLHEILKSRNWALQDFDGDEPTPEMKARIGNVQS